VINFVLVMERGRVGYSHRICSLGLFVHKFQLSRKVDLDGGMCLFTNLFDYADDIVMLAPSWHAMQALITKILYSPGFSWLLHAVTLAFDLLTPKYTCGQKLREIPFTGF